MEFLIAVLQAITYAAYIAFPLCLCLGSYRLLLHPLHTYPGPVVGRLTDAYSGFFAIRKKLHLVTYQNFSKYGPVVRQAPNRLVFNTLQAVQGASNRNSPSFRIHAKPPKYMYLNPRVTKGEAYRNSQMRAKYPSIINAIDKDQHRSKRRFISQVLSDRSMRSFEPTMSAQVDVFLRLLLKSCGDDQVVDMTQRCKRLATDIIGYLAFGYPFKTQTDESHRYLIGIIDAMSWRISAYMAFPLIAPLERFMALMGIRAILKFGSLVKTMIKSRMAEGKDAHNDLYSYVADDIGKGPQGFHYGELWPEAILFITAGGTTTSTNMSALFFYLSRNPSCYETLATEIRSKLSSASEICASPQLSSCRYLRACIDEALRMSPPTLTPLWRQQDAKDRSGQPFVVDGHVIPRGTQVAVSLYSLLHNEEYFPDAFTFNPERWLDSHPASGEGSVGEKQSASLASMRKAFVPFLVGDRSCAGKAMAYLETSLTLARALWYFDFEAAPGAAGEVGAGKPGRGDGRGRPEEYQLDDIFVATHQGPNLVFRKRGDFWKELEMAG